MGRVAKQNPDRTVSDEGRFISDKREPNKWCSKWDHAPALQPKHREVCREILFWDAHCPGVDVLLAKRDVKSAFYLIWVHEEDVWIFVTSWPAEHWGLEGRIIVMQLVLDFGWLGSPGEFQLYSWVVKEYHRHHRPRDGTWHSDWGFQSAFLLDDQILIEPDIGVRRWMSSRCASRGMRLV